jgi:hypothetical protein
MFFACLRVVAAVICSWRTLDSVRVLGVFVGYEVILYNLWSWLVSLGWSEYFGIVGNLCLVLLGMGIPAVCLLMLLSRRNYFRKPATLRLSWAQAYWLMPLNICVSLFEATYAQGQPTH